MKCKALKVVTTTTVFIFFNCKSLFCFLVELALKFDANSKIYHHIFIKKHTVHKTDDSKPLGRTLFVLNIPPYATEDSVKHVFSVAGVVQSVVLCEGDDHGFKTGYIVFKKSSSLSRAWRLKKLPPLSSDEHPVLVGLQKYIRDYNNSIVDPAQLQKEVDTFMAEYDKKLEAEKQNAKGQNVDEDGWTVVTKKGRNPGLSRKESVESKIAQKLQKKQKKKRLENFYTFQVRESKMNHIVKLREKFEEDKKRIEAFKKSRKFKPF